MRVVKENQKHRIGRVRGLLQQSNDFNSEFPGSQGKNGNITGHEIFVFTKRKHQSFKKRGRDVF